MLESTGNIRMSPFVAGVAKGDNIKNPSQNIKILIYWDGIFQISRFHPTSFWSCQKAP